MKTSSAFVLGFLGSLGFACKTAETSAPVASSATPQAESSVPGAASVESSTAAAVAPAPAQALSADAPTSFEKGQKETIAAAIGLGCEPKSLDGWLELLCRKKNGTGGHPVRALVRDPLAAPTPSEQAGTPTPREGSEASEGEAGAAQGEEVLPGDRGELRLVLPFREGAKRSVTLEWTDTRYTLELDAKKTTLTWAGSAIAHRKACQVLLDENRARIDAAQKLGDTEKVLASESNSRLLDAKLDAVSA